MSAGEGARLTHGRARIALPVLLAALLLPAAPAAAKLRTYTLQYGPVRMAGFNVRLPKAKVPAPHVNDYIVHMNAELVKAIRNPEVRARLAGQGAEVVTMTPAEQDRFFNAERARWAKVVAEAHITAD